MARGRGVEIRKAQAGEADALSALAFEAKAQWGYPRETLESWRESLRITPAELAAKTVLVATIDGKIAGFCSLAPSRGAWELDNLWVAPGLTRRGIGRALLGQALESAFRGGAASVAVDADPHAEAFYLSCGGVKRGEVPAPIPGEPNRVRPQLEFVAPPGEHRHSEPEDSPT